jgi:hypothetical protein
LDNEEVKEHLEQVGRIEATIDCKLAEQRQWYELADSITANMSCERVQSSGSQSKMADAVVKCLAMVDEIALAVDRLIAKKREIVSLIEQVKNPTEYKLLHQKYIQHKELKVIADNFNSSYDWAKKTHQRALTSVAEIMKDR